MAYPVVNEHRPFLQRCVLTGQPALLPSCTEPEGYFDLLPWESLANCNHNYLMSGRRRHYLRNMGGLTFFEV